jgi:protein involved in polysaccharide export with SLBB domain
LWWFVALLTLCFHQPLVAQIPGLPPGVRPTPEQAREILRTRPDLVEQLRQRMQASGLTPDQVRARLRAEGYPEDLLDPYLVGADTTQPVTPAPNTLDAVRSLGILSAQGVDSLQRLDSLRVVSDSQRAAMDSLLVARADSIRRDSLADTLAARRGGLKMFGYELFRRYSNRFQAPLNGPVDPSYRLGPGDVLVLILTGDVELTQTLEVTREGFVLIPQVGTVYVANLTLGQLEDLLYTRLGRTYSGVRRGPNARTRFSITVSRIRNIQIYVTGDVLRAGAYQIPANSTVLSALYEAGGPSSNGTFRRVEVRRAGKLVDTVDVYDYLLRGNDRSDVRLETGDVVFVPVRGGQVKMAGRVLRPAIYELKASETLRDLLAAAGGFDANAVQNRVQIQRIQPPEARAPGGRERVVIDVTADQLAAGPPAFPMAPGDSVTVFEVPRRLRDYVSVRGNVWIEGRVGYASGLKLSEAIRLAGGPKPDVYLGQILISRVRSDSSRIQLRSAFADSAGRVTDDLTLEPEDEVQVFSRAAFRIAQYVTIVGAVRRSGRIPYREGMTLRDAVLLADGVTEDADLTQAEIARLPADRPTGALAQTVRVPIDSSYLFAQGTRPGGDAPPLQPYDNVLILRRPGYELQRLVALTGQVQHPGRYALTSKTERLSDLITRAGGLTPEAYAGGVAFYRRAEPRFAVSSRPVTDTSRTVQPIPPGYKDRVGIDLPRVLKDPGFRDNIILASGDSINIPEFDPIVTVLGAVNAPGPVAYTPGKNLDWYVRAAGGYAQNGDSRRPYLTQPDGKKETVSRRFLLSDDQPTPRPGAVVYVPTKRGSDQPSNLPAVLGVVASVLASLTTVAVVLTR